MSTKSRERMSKSKICDGTCFGPFATAIKAHFGEDAELPTAWRINGGQMVTMLEPHYVKHRDGKRRKKTALTLPYCGICGKKTS